MLLRQCADTALPQLNPGSPFLLHIIPCDGHAPDCFVLGDFIHDIKHKFLKDCAQRPRARLFQKRALRNYRKRFRLKIKLHLIHRKKLFVLPDNRIFRLGKNADQHITA